jgi:hypothetical protein
MPSILKLSALIALVALSSLQSVASSSMAAKEYPSGIKSSQGAKKTSSKAIGQEPRASKKSARKSSTNKSGHKGSGKKSTPLYPTEEIAPSAMEEAARSARGVKGNSGIFIGKQAARELRKEKRRQERMGNSPKPTETDVEK